MNLASNGKNTVLVVDDDQAIRESVKDVLKLEGHDVVTAANGQEALDKLKTIKPAVILLDIRMPIMDGWEFQEVFQAEPNYKSIPLFVFCAGNKNDARPPGINPTGFLSKPIDVEDLLSSLQPYLH